jgi:hypothetical protein
MAEPNNETKQMLAVGVAGYAVAMETLNKLEERGVLDRNECASILDAAIAGLERTEENTPHEAFRLARHMLDRQLQLWQKERPQ